MLIITTFTIITTITTYTKITNITIVTTLTTITTIQTKNDNCYSNTGYPLCGCYMQKNKKSTK